MVDTKIAFESVLNTKNANDGPMICAAELEDLTPLSEKYDLYLMPITKINLTVQLPKTKVPGQCISTWEVMEKLKKKASPHSFKSLIVTKNTIEFIRFEGEFDSKFIMDLAVSRLNRTALKLSGFVEPLKVKCAVMKLGSTRHEWESYFRDNPNMNEHKAGYRPDTIHLTNLPIKWFGGSRPDTKILIDVFKTFGDIKRFHVPLLDELEICDRSGGFKKFTHSESLTFETFIMFKEYIGFVKAMDSMRGMKLVKQLQEVNKLLEYDIKVDFDKTKHLSDKAIKKRKLDKEYGIKNSEEMKKLKEETGKQRMLYEERIKNLKKRKAQAKSLLALIIGKVAEREKLKEEEEKERKRREVAEFEEKRKKKLGEGPLKSGENQPKLGENALKLGENALKLGENPLREKSEGKSGENKDDFPCKKSGVMKSGIVSVVSSKVVRVKKDNDSATPSSFDPIRGTTSGRFGQDWDNFGHRDDRRYHPYTCARRDHDRSREYDPRHDYDSRDRDQYDHRDRYHGHSQDRDTFYDQRPSDPLWRQSRSELSRSSSPGNVTKLSSAIIRPNVSRSVVTPPIPDGGKVPKDQSVKGKVSKAPWMTGTSLFPLKICLINDKVKRHVTSPAVEASVSSIDTSKATISSAKNVSGSNVSGTKLSSSVEKRTLPLTAATLSDVPKVKQKTSIKVAPKKMDLNAVLAKRAAILASGTKVASDGVKPVTSTKVAVKKVTSVTKKQIVTGIKLTGLECINEVPKSTGGGALSSRFSSSAKVAYDAGTGFGNGRSSSKAIATVSKTSSDVSSDDLPKGNVSKVASNPPILKQTIHINPKMIRRLSAALVDSAIGTNSCQATNSSQVTSSSQVASSSQITSSGQITSSEVSSVPTRRKLKRPVPLNSSSQESSPGLSGSVNRAHGTGGNPEGASGNPEGAPGNVEGGKKKKTIVLSTESGEMIVKPTLLITTKNDRFKKVPRVPITASDHLRFNLKSPYITASDHLRFNLNSFEENRLRSHLDSSDLRQQLVSKELARSGSRLDTGSPASMSTRTGHGHKEGRRKNRPPSSLGNSVIIELNPDSESEECDNEVNEVINEDEVNEVINEDEVSEVIYEDEVNEVINEDEVNEYECEELVYD